MSKCIKIEQTPEEITDSVKTFSEMSVGSVIIHKTIEQPNYNPMGTVDSQQKAFDFQSSYNAEMLGSTDIGHYKSDTFI